MPFPFLLLPLTDALRLMMLREASRCACFQTIFKIPNILCQIKLISHTSYLRLNLLWYKGLEHFEYNKMMCNKAQLKSVRVLKHESSEKDQFDEYGC